MKPQSKLLKYQIGLAAIGILTIVMLVLTLGQASATKQDSDTDKRANDASEKLNAFYSDDYTVPESLSAAGYKGDATNLSYTKLSDSSYKFCVTYKANSSGFDASSTALSLATGGLAGNNSYDSTDSTYLYVPYTHHKGANCQTIKPYGDSGGGVTCGIVCDDTSQQSEVINNSSSSDASLLGGVQAKARDSKRKTDMGALQAQLEAYYAMNNTYPTFSDFNSTAWRSANMKGLDPNALQDPNSTTTTLINGTKPTSALYAYNVTPAGCSDIAGATNPCANFGVYAMLESDGSIISKVSDN